MRLLLTRAAEDAARTRARLEAMGHRVTVSPVLEMVSLGAAWPAGVVDAMMATSGQAFAALGEGLAPEARHLMPLFVVGERTAEIAREARFSGALTIASTAAGLAADIQVLTHKPKRLVYCAGRDRKPDIENMLADIGIPIDVLEAYEARAVSSLASAASAALRKGAIDAVLHFSRRSAALFCELAQADGLDIGAMRHLCLSEDVAVPLHEADCVTLEIAEAPNEAALLALLDRP